MSSLRRRHNSWGFKKPPPGAQIDWSNGRAQGLILCAIGNEGGGTKMINLARQGKYNGTFQSGASWDKNKVLAGPAVLLNGNQTTGYVDFGTSTDLTPPAITMSVWAYATVFNTQSYNTTISRDNGTTCYHQIFVKNTGTLAVYMNGTLTGISYDGTGSHTLSTNTWYHLCMTWDSNTQFLTGYVNGNRDANPSGNAGPLNSVSGVQFVLGTDTGVASPNRAWNGMLDNARVWNRALSQAEVQMDYVDPFGIFARRRRNTVSVPSFSGDYEEGVRYFPVYNW